MFQTGVTNKRANDSPNRQQMKQKGRTHHATVMDAEMEKPLAPTDQVSTENNDAHFDIIPVLSKFEASEEEMKKAHEPFATLLGVGNAIPALFNITELASKVMIFKAKTLVPNQVDTCKRDGLSSEDWLIFFTSLLVDAQFDALQVELYIPRKQEIIDCLVYASRLSHMKPSTLFGQIRQGCIKPTPMARCWYGAKMSLGSKYAPPMKKKAAKSANLKASLENAKETAQVHMFEHDNSVLLKKSKYADGEKHPSHKTLSDKKLNPPKKLSKKEKRRKQKQTRKRRHDPSLSDSENLESSSSSSESESSSDSDSKVMLVVKNPHEKQKRQTTIVSLPTVMSAEVTKTRTNEVCLQLMIHTKKKSNQTANTVCQDHIKRIFQALQGKDDKVAMLPWMIAIRNNTPEITNLSHFPKAWTEIKPYVKTNMKGIQNNSDNWIQMCFTTNLPPRDLTSLMGSQMNPETSPPSWEAK
jgi:hypothetical protein